MERYLQQIDNAVANYTREVLAAGRLCKEAATDDQKQAILARLDAEAETAKGIITEAKTRLLEHVTQALERIDSALAQKGKY